jgi:hypothetical protein
MRCEVRFYLNPYSLRFTNGLFPKQRYCFENLFYIKRTNAQPDAAADICKNAEIQRDQGKVIVAFNPTRTYLSRNALAHRGPHEPVGFRPFSR